MRESSLDSNAGVPVTDVRTMRHGFGQRAATGVSLTAIRPIVGFGGTALLISYAGLNAWTALVALLAILLLVAAVFGTLASRWPVEGSVQGWARQLVGARGGFLTGWLYLCSYALFMASLAYFDVQRIFYLLGLATPGVLLANVAAALIVLLATLVNFLPRAWGMALVIAAVVASLIGCIGYSIVLIASHATRGIGDVIGQSGAQPSGGWFTGSFLVALAWASAFAFRGFELPADMSEEIVDARRAVPRAMFTTLIVGGVLTILAGLAIALVVPAAPAVTSDLASNPYAASVGTTIEAAMGTGAAKLMALLVVIATFAAVSVFQMAASRTVWTMARDRELPASAWLLQLSEPRRTPRNALIAVGIVGVLLPFVISNVKTAYILQGASVAPLMIAFLVPMAGLLTGRARSSWKSGPFSLGGWATPLAALAALALLGLGVNALWPREVLFGKGNSAWMPAILLVLVAVAGVLLMTWAFREDGVHVRNRGHVDRDLHERILLAHSGTCNVCHRGLAEGEEVFWNPEAHVTICTSCDEDVVV
jgi:amino acid transporter